MFNVITEQYSKAIDVKKILRRPRKKGNTWNHSGLKIKHSYKENQPKPSQENEALIRVRLAGLNARWQTAL